MDNAVRHRKRSRIIRLSGWEQGRGYHILCEDDRVAGEKEKIFEQGVAKNTGVGLFLPREILGITGVTIKETGEPGKGAGFRIVVPKGVYRIRASTEM